MTNEQAIRELNRIYMMLSEDMKKALDMAIKALEKEPCEDAISRQAVLDLAQKGVLVSNGNYESVCKAINELPFVKPQEPKMGHWFAWKPEEDVWRTTCSECGEETRALWNYCPNCGARMVDEQESEDKE